MNSHAKEAIEKSKPTDKTVVENKITNKATKCVFENFGMCKEKENCKSFHPTRTCQSQSKLGSCPCESTCNMRLPRRICFHFQSHGFCKRGNDCHFRHPIEFSYNFSNSYTFLGGKTRHGRDKVQSWSPAKKNLQQPEEFQRPRSFHHQEIRQVNQQWNRRPYYWEMSQNVNQNPQHQQKQRNQAPTENLQHQDQRRSKW